VTVRVLLRNLPVRTRYPSVFYDCGLFCDRFEKSGTRVLWSLAQEELQAVGATRSQTAMKMRDYAVIKVIRGTPRLGRRQPWVVSHVGPPLIMRTTLRYAECPEMGHVPVSF
jgi:hypothetical protein